MCALVVLPIQQVLLRRALRNGLCSAFWALSLHGSFHCGKAGCGSGNKPPIVAAVSLDEAGHPILVKVPAVQTFSFAAIADWAQHALARGCEVISDGLACFRGATEVGCIHWPVIVNGRHPEVLPDCRWSNTVISNLKTNFSGAFHAPLFEKYADRYFGAFCCRFNRRCTLDEMTGRILRVATQCISRSEPILGECVPFCLINLPIALVERA